MTDCIFPKMLDSPGKLYAPSSPVTQATDGGLKTLLGLTSILGNIQSSSSGLLVINK